MMLQTFSGCLLEQMDVVTPAAVAISAAMSFVSIPPVPKLEPAVAVLTAKPSDPSLETALKDLTLVSDCRHIVDSFDQPGVGVLPWIRRIQPIHIGQKEKVVRGYHRSRNGRKGIVVSKFDFLCQQPLH
jgi:hypothetical protein